MVKLFVTTSDGCIASASSKILSVLPNARIADWTDEDLSAIAPLVWLSDGGVGPEPAGVAEYLTKKTINKVLGSRTLL